MESLRSRRVPGWDGPRVGWRRMVVTNGYELAIMGNYIYTHRIYVWCIYIYIFIILYIYIYANMTGVY